MAAEQLDMDHVGAHRGELLERQPGQARSVGHHDTVTLDDQPLDQLLSFG